MPSVADPLQLGFDVQSVPEANKKPEPAPKPPPKEERPPCSECGVTLPDHDDMCPSLVIADEEPLPHDGEMAMPPGPIGKEAPLPQEEVAADPTTTGALFDSRPDPTTLSRSIIDEYCVPPFTTFDTRQGYWQDRKRLWIALGIQSEVGRDSKLTYGKFNQSYEEETRRRWAAMTPEEKASDEGRRIANSGALNPHTKERYGEGTTSIFDPVLTEIVYRWMCPPNGIILDPFAGGSVRGIVASSLGRQYLGIELRPEQVAANYEQANAILRDTPAPMWIKGDSHKVLQDNIDPVDLVFTCPPYADLEVYSDDPADLSNMAADKFDRIYSEILSLACHHLAPDRFAAIVISNIRDKNGHMRDLCRLTIDAMHRGGAKLYNEAVLLNVSGTGALRVRKQFNTSRKLVRTHQSVLFFVKGDPRKAADAIGPVMRADDGKPS